MVQLLNPYMTTGKTIALTIWAFVSKVISLLFNMLSGFVTAFLPGSKYLLILWLQSPSTVILEPPNRKSITASTFSASICYEVMKVKEENEKAGLKFNIQKTKTKASGPITSRQIVREKEEV